MYVIAIQFPQLGPEPEARADNRPAIQKAEDNLARCRQRIDQAIQEHSQALAETRREIMAHYSHDPRLCGIAANGPVYCGSAEGSLAGAKQAKEMTTPLLDRLQLLIEKVPRTIDNQVRIEFSAELLAFDESLERLDQSLSAELVKLDAGLHQLQVEYHAARPHGSKAVSYNMTAGRLSRKRREISRLVSQVLLNCDPATRWLRQAAEVFRLHEG